MSDDQFDHVEFKESYAHYRHLEQERSRHLAFFFTLVGGLLGLLGLLLKDGKISDWFPFVTVLIILFLQVLEIVAFAAVRRIGDAREQHAKTMRYFRNKLSSDKYVAELWNEFEKRSHVSVQTAAEGTFHVFAFLFVLAAGGLSIYAANSGYMPWWQSTTLLCLTVVLFVVHVGAWWCLRPPKAPRD